MLENTIALSFSNVEDLIVTRIHQCVHIVLYLVCDLRRELFHIIII